MIRNIKYKHSLGTLEHDDGITESEIRNAIPNFFKTKFGKRETFTFYRGFVICRHTVQFTGEKPKRRTVVYVYVPEFKDTLCVTSELGSIRQAKAYIDVILAYENLGYAPD